MASLREQEPILYEITPSVLVADIDNTLIPSCEVIGETRLAMRDTIAGALPNRSRDSVQQAMKTHYSRHGINDYRLLEGMVAQGFIDSKQQDTLMPLVRSAYHEKRNIHMRPFDGVTELLRKCKESDIEVGALTDDDHVETLIKFGAPQVKHLREEAYLNWLVARHSGQKYQNPESFAALNRAMAHFEYPTATTHKLKPDTDLELVLGLSDVEDLTQEQKGHFIRQGVAILGDNWNNDMGTAISNKMRGYYARWGHAQIIKYREVLSGFMSRKDLNLFAPIPHEPASGELIGHIRPLRHPDDLTELLSLSGQRSSSFV
jgi:phosphoglycolate phosphatase-like HAD superfamily hydrolase